VLAQTFGINVFNKSVREAVDNNKQLSFGILAGGFAIFIDGFIEWVMFFLGLNLRRGNPINAKQIGS
jgi:hypothetical protein